MNLFKLHTTRYRSAEFGVGSALSKMRRNYARSIAVHARDMTSTADYDGFIRDGRGVFAVAGGLYGGVPGAVVGGLGNAARVAIENRNKPQEEQRSILRAGLKGAALGGAGAGIVAGSLMSKVGGDLGKRARTLYKRGDFRTYQ